MKKQFTASITLLFFVIFTVSCSMEKEIELQFDAVPMGEKDIVGVQMKSGEYIEFTKNTPARITNGQIKGYVNQKSMELNRADFEYVRGFWARMNKKANLIKTRDGRMFRILHAEERENSVNFLVEMATPQAISVPISDVELVWVRRTDPVATFLAAIGGVVLAAGLVIAFIAATKESCPFVYSYNGQKYVFDAEPYGGAICPGLQRTEWCRLEHLRPTGGRYRIMVTNEVDETQCTDEIKLLAIDHPRGVSVAADENGGIHTFRRPLPPDRAYDREGRSLLGRIAADDKVYWMTPAEELDPDGRSEMKDELTFEFAKPRGAKTVKLLFDGCNTLWASHMLKRFLELWGGGVNDYYQALNERGPFALAILEWNRNAEMCLLQLRMETASGWRTATTLVGGGPFVAESRAYVIDIGDVPGDVLKVRLTPPAGFWMINQVAVDYSPDEPVEVSELSPIAGVDSRGQDVLDLLQQTDGRYLRMPETGDRALLEFAVPAPKESLERSMMIKVSGYYDIHLDARGYPQHLLLGRFRENPDLAIEYSLREYRQWRLERLNEAREVR